MVLTMAFGGAAPYASTGLNGKGQEAQHGG